MSQPTPSQPKTHVGIWAICVRVIAHGLGVASIAALLFVPFINKATLSVMFESAHHLDFVAMSGAEALLHIGLASCLWALVVIGYQILTAKRKPVQRVLKLTEGSVMTETLIVLPVFLLLTFGIAQLAINNMAGLVANTAVFQAGRTAWLWSAEVGVQGSSVNSGQVERKVRAQAAAVLTPVAPAEFIQNTSGLSEEAKQMRGILLGSQIPFPLSQDMGKNGMTAAPALLVGENLTNMPEKDSSFFRAFDTSGFRQRTARKYTFAFHSAEIEVINRGDAVGAHLTYHHFQAMPMVGAIFGDFDTVAGRAGYYAQIEREFTMPTQIPPNRKLP